jgi:hypothetical protein
MVEPVPADVYAQVLAERAAAITERDEAIAERDRAVKARKRAVRRAREAIAERDYCLSYFFRLGGLLRRVQLIGLFDNPKGVELRSLYPSHANAMAIAGLVRDLRAMFTLTGEPEPDLKAIKRGVERAAAELRA